MEVDNLVIQFRALVVKIERSANEYANLEANKKTSACKKKRISDGTRFWDELSKIVTRIKELTEKNPDQCFEDEVTKITKVYKDYTTDLIKPSQNFGSTNNLVENQDEMDRFNQQQTVRILALRKAIGEVFNKIDNNEVLSASYCRIKSKLITDAWTRIQIANEECTFSRESLEDDYIDSIQDLTEKVELVLLTLQDQLEVANSKQSDANAVKLPRVKIPKFGGDYFEWVEFRDTFSTLVIDNKTLADGQRMQLLKDNLVGEAKPLIRDLTISAANFKCAWDRLINRFDNNRVVVQKHLHKLMTQPQAKNEAASMKRLLDTTDQILLALDNLKRPVDAWDDWIILTIVPKLSEDSRKEWERKIGATTELPTWDQLKEFLEEEFRMLEGVENGHKKTNGNHNQEKPRFVKAFQASVEKRQCAACSGGHGLFECTKFTAMSTNEKWLMAKRNKLCYKCLQLHKDKLSCDKKKPCKKCNGSHSTWLHNNEVMVTAVGVNNEITTAIGTISHDKQVLLATALLSAIDGYGRKITLRALIDNGSQGSLVSNNAAMLLQLKPIATSKFISGLGGNKAGKSRLINVTIAPTFASTFRLTAECYIINKITKNLPDSDLCIDNWKHLNGLKLADPTFHKMGRIDMLLGSDVIAEILQNGLIKGRKGEPMAQETKLGWIVSGKIDPAYPKNEVKCLISTHESDMQNIQRFWELEELNPARILTPNEQECEDFYKGNHSRNEQGIFTVKIPFKSSLNPEKLLEGSRNQCWSRFLQLEKKLAKDEKLRIDYSKVIHEYIQLGHMVPVNAMAEKLYYIPHHAVIKPDSLTTKLRVVFDASAKTKSGYSLNDCMFVGAKQQMDIWDIMIRWRRHRIVFKADIEKMYRMIKLDVEDQRYHTVFWRDDPSETLKEYQLTTATFGTAAAPFMATRTLCQIAEELGNTKPVAREIIKNDFYVDDLMSGAGSTDEAIAAIQEVTAAMGGAGMSLRKWASNSKLVLDTLPENMTERSLQTINDDETTKALGVQWNPQSDKFSFKVKLMPNSVKLTKRALLSESSEIFDPLGWLAPTVIVAKLLMQKVWLASIDWDEAVADDIRDNWTRYKSELPIVEKVSIDRWIGLKVDTVMELHGFCDASEAAYAAVVYTRIKQGDQYKIQLISAKSRVAPIKTKITLPKMELCAAVLVSNLLQKTKLALGTSNIKITAWSDSMVTLGWIRQDPLRWKTFVANRVSEIQSNGNMNWRYVKSEENPADCASRGIGPTELVHHKLWWHGPNWLSNNDDTWQRSEVVDTELEMRCSKNIIVNVAMVQQPTNEMFERYSSWSKLKRVVAYCRRFISKKKGKLSVQELEESKWNLIRLCQQEVFGDEIRRLKAGKAVSRNGKLRALNPWMDDNDIMRVNGRLVNSQLEFEQKNPAILPAKHHLTELIIEQMHTDTYHGGVEMMLSLLRRNFWIMNGKRRVTKVAKNCVTCRRFKGSANQQLMGNLPKARVQFERVFLNSGVDYAGPVEVKSSNLRNAKIQKGYIALYICMATKAVHLELVCDESTDAFLASFERFVARRGLVSKMYSDNGTNFIGGSNVLDKKLWLARNHELADLLVIKGVDWSFIPPGSPNFGGLWERNIQTMKNHIKKVTKQARLTFEEFSTMLCQIEACINSRPLCPVSNNPENLDVLTPGHFIIGEALKAIPAPIMLDSTSNRVKRWNYVQLLSQHFWDRWHKEYLVQLQQRNKWQTPTENVKIGDMVVIKEENIPPRMWLMGRIVDVHPGKDGLIRVATVKMRTNTIDANTKLYKTTELKRPVNKLCVLMSEKEEASPTADDTTNQNNQDLSSDEKSRTHDVGLTKKPTLRNNGINMSTILLALFAFCLLVGGGTAQHTLVKVTKMDENTGIYFEELGRAEVIRTDWHIFIKFNLEGYAADYERLSKISVKLNNMCAALTSATEKSNCDDTMGIVNHKLAEIAQFNEFLMFNGDEQKRSKRSIPFGGIGWLQHEIFGVMASEQAEIIQDNFAKADEKADHLLELIKNQTSIVEGTINLMKSTEEQINKNYDKIDASFTKLQASTNYIDWKLRTMVLSVTTLASVNRLETVQERMVDMVTDLHQGHISSHVITPQQLKKQLELINGNLPMGVMVPEVGQHDLKSLYKMMRGTIRVTNKAIIVDVTIPLVANTEYQVIKIIPIPMEYNGQEITIKPESEYLMINLKKDNFYQMSEQELDNCIIVNPKKRLCKTRRPLFSANAMQSACERELLMTNTIQAGCKLASGPKIDTWINLKAKNTWIYKVQNELTVNVVCGTIVQSVKLDGVGLVKLEPGCEINQQKMTLIAESIKQTNGDSNYDPSATLNEAAIKSKKNFTSQSMNLEINHTQQMAELTNQIEDLKVNSTTHKRMWIFHNTTYGTTITALLILIIIMVIKRRQIQQRIIKWHASTQMTEQSGVTNDVELQSINVGNNGSNSTIDNSANDNHTKSTCRYEAGECPFRT